MAGNQEIFKKADIIIQSLAFVTIGAIWFFNEDLAITSFFIGIGGWQLLSMVTHLILKWNQHFLGRRIYQIGLLALVVIFLLSLLYAPLMIWVLYLYLFITPVFAFYYLIVCYLEVFGRK